MAAVHRAPEWAKRNVKVIGLSANDLKDHERWVQDINEFGSKTVGPTDVQFPIVSHLRARFVSRCTRPIGHV